MALTKSLLALAGLPLTLAALPLTLGGCGALGLGPSAPSASATPAATGQPWVVTEQGTATATPTPSGYAGAVPTGLPPISFPPTPSACPQINQVDEVMIPVVATPGTGSITVSWPETYGSDYRVAAVPQDLIVGDQPAEVWHAVPASTACTVTTTITGLTSGVPYVVWLDAPHTGTFIDGSRHPYSGRSSVVVPK